MSILSVEAFMAIGQEQPDGSVVIIEPDFQEEAPPLPCQIPVEPTPAQPTEE